MTPVLVMTLRRNGLVQTRGGVALDEDAAAQVWRLLPKIHMEGGAPMQRTAGQITSEALLEWVARQHLGENRGAISGTRMGSRR